MKKFLSALLAVGIVFGGAAPTAVNPQNYVISASAAEEYTEETYDVLKYKNYGDHIEISDCYRLATSVEIPSEISGVPVTSIGSWAFEHCSKLTSITIPDSITRIDKFAFNATPWFKAKQKENPLVIVSNILIDGTTCSGDVVIPASVASISAYAFCNCSGLTSVTIPNSVTSIGEYAFESCSSLNPIVIPDSVTSIGDHAFYYCQSLISITIPDSVISIGISAFKGCLNLTEILVDKNNQYYVSINGVLFNKDKTEIYAYPKMKTETKYSIPDSVTSIADGAFYGCSNLSSITIPNGVKSIEDWAFIGCSGLKSIFIPNSVESIGKNTFLGFHGTIYGCEGSYAQTYAEEKGIEFGAIGLLGDVDDDGAVNSSDASLVLREYALIATGEAPAFSESQKIAADVNADSVVDSSDASTILAYYAYTATGGTEDINNFMK